MSYFQLILLIIAVLSGCLLYAIMLLRISKNLGKGSRSRSKILIPVLIGFLLGILLLVYTISSI